VTLIALDDGARLTGLQRIVENDASVDAMAEGANGNGHANGDGDADGPTNGGEGA
jgi:DNA gyrase subunit A